MDAHELMKLVALVSSLGILAVVVVHVLIKLIEEELF